MEITDIRVRQATMDGKMKAIVSVTFDHAIVIHDIKIIEGADKLFLAMPSRKTPDGVFKDIAHPISSQMREYLESAIITKYYETLSEMQATPDVSTFITDNAGPYIELNKEEVLV